MVTIIDAHFPLVMALVDGELTREDIAVMREAYARLHERKQRFFLCQETRTVQLPSALIRKELARLNDDFAERIRANVVGIGVIVAGKVYAGALRAIFWLSKEAAPMAVETTAAAMLRVVEQSCAAEHIVLPASLRGFMTALDADLAAGRGLRAFQK